MYSAKDPGTILPPITLSILRQVPWWTINVHCITLHVNYSQLSAPKDVTTFLAVKEMTNTTRDKTDEEGWMSSMGFLRDKNESTHKISNCMKQSLYQTSTL
jgi:hypothetical protein